MHAQKVQNASPHFTRRPFLPAHPATVAVLFNGYLMVAAAATPPPRVWLPACRTRGSALALDVFHVTHSTSDTRTYGAERFAGRTSDVCNGIKHGS